MGGSLGGNAMPRDCHIPVSSNFGGNPNRQRPCASDGHDQARRWHCRCVSGKRVGNRFASSHTDVAARLLQIEALYPSDEEDSDFIADSDEEEDEDEEGEDEEGEDEEDEEDEEESSSDEEVTVGSKRAASGSQASDSKRTRMGEVSVPLTPVGVCAWQS